MANNEMNKNKVSVGPSGSGALSSRLEGKGVALRTNLIFLAALVLVVVVAALVS